MTSIKSISIFGFSVIMYLMSLGTLIFFALFLLNIGEYTISSSSASLEFDLALIAALGINLSLILLFGLSHSIMARPKFKRWFKQYTDAALVRPMYLLVSVVTLNLLILVWRPIGGWSLDLRGTGLGYVLIGTYALGWIIEVTASYQIDHFHLFGLRQSLAKLKGVDPSKPEFSIPPFYRVVRHPIYTGWLMVFWLTPYLTLSHLLFALGMTIYIRIATYYEEQDLIDYYGSNYTQYMRQVPVRYIPLVV